MEILHMSKARQCGNTHFMVRFYHILNEAAMNKLYILTAEEMGELQMLVDEMKPVELCFTDHTLEESIIYDRCTKRIAHILGLEVKDEK